MREKIEKILKIWHKHYANEENQYSEFEPSDIEYFVGCLLYNHFAFSKAVPTMKTIDLSYDFLSTCGDVEYEEVKSVVEEIKFETELEAVDFLLEYIEEARRLYTPVELYLLDRLLKHVTLLKERYMNDVEAQSVDFQRLRFH
ncbi:hypothetical protein [Sulfurimonas sp. C5]|uniref:hypothetical protein n=1 Tax=Sulfurimonas sp. C5 TaxID=3036947 RepID=UPI002453B053|nr:hypothetical protein [Sulfurimonas sp. C5]MDH4944137.1 hypothetical protein [Sulfurimonas sp. C5]